MSSRALEQEKGGFVSRSTGAPAKRLAVLDGLRGVAAFGVINDHVSSETLRMLSPGRYLAVDFFWVLSGFVLALAYDARLKQGMSARTFMSARIIRLYPLYLLGLAIGLAFVFYGALRHWGNVTPFQVAVAAGFGLFFVPLPPFFSSIVHLFPLNGPSYSLFYELVVNLIYGVIARLLNLRVLLSVLTVSAVLMAFILPRHAPGAGWQWADVGIGLIRVIYCFFAGVFIFRVQERIRLPSLSPWLAVAAYLAIIAIPAPDDWRPFYNLVAILIFMPLLVALSAGSVVHGFTARLFILLGMLSYGVYVLHVPLAALVHPVFSSLGFHPPGLVIVFLIAALAALIAWVADKIYDQPVRRWMTARLIPARAKAVHLD
jgi:peptidoglycan/LPS O-acetylase OafA/YrhL